EVIKESLTRIKDSITDNIELVQKDKITENNIIHFILNLEFSEWNDIFLYIIDSARHNVSESKQAAARIRNHIQKIEYNIKNIFHDDQNILAQLETITKTWEYKILIIEDDEKVLSLLKIYLNNKYQLFPVTNLAEAVERIKSDYFDLIIYNKQMTQDGNSLFDFPLPSGLKLNKKTILLSDSENNANTDQQNNPFIFQKPIKIQQFVSTVDKMILDYH
ncbi:MAG: response regulator, partial [Spirochaetes bacterium]|nr:response regulator [Spirochaetota bacterium]